MNYNLYNQKENNEDQISVSTTDNTLSHFSIPLNTQMLPVQITCGLPSPYVQVLCSSSTNYLTQIEQGTNVALMSSSSSNEINTRNDQIIQSLKGDK